MPNPTDLPFPVRPRVTILTKPLGTKDWPIYPVKQATVLLDVVCIGISTGGPAALFSMFPQIDENFPLPILIVQHIPNSFTQDFINSLAKVSPIPVKKAEEGDVIKAGVVLVAPGDRHMTVIRRGAHRVIKLLDSEAVGGHKPSVDVLFASVAQYYRERTLAVLMTGMGKDGARQMGELYNLGALTIAQDSASCVVYGMPKMAIECGYVHHVVALSKMAITLNHFAQRYSGNTGKR